MSRRRPPELQEAAGSGTFKYIMAGGIVVAALLLVVATSKDPPPPAPPTTTTRAPVVRPVPAQAPRPAHLDELQKLTVKFNSSQGTTAGRDALYARAKIAAEHKDYRSASEDLRRLLFRRDVEGALRTEIEALLRQVETERRKGVR